jgi:hypothetical protein
MHTFNVNRRALWLLLLVLASVTVVAPPNADANGIPFKTGDVLTGVGTGFIKHFSPTGALLDTLNTGTTCSEQLGMAFKLDGHLLATSSFGSCFDSGKVVEFDSNGNLLGPFGSSYSASTESIVVDSSGNVYVGQPDGTRQVLKFSSGGTLLASYTPDPQDRGTDWLDLAADQCTLRYTSEGSSIKQFNVCTNTQLPDFASGLSGPCYAQRIRPNSEELVACTDRAYRLNSSGAVIQTYQIPGTTLLFALNLDPDNKTFWTADYYGGSVFRVEIATGAIVAQFSGNTITTLSGLAIVGEITAATQAPPETTSYYITTTNSTTLKNAGRDLALSQIAAGVNQDSVASLLFRAPTFKNDIYGVAGLGSSTPLSTVALLAEAFASGYYNALGSNTTLHVRIVIATSNGTTMCGGSEVTFGHGQAWAQIVESVGSWVIGQGYSAQVDVAAGSDMEAGSAVWPAGSACNSAGRRQWAGPTETRNWVDGYASVVPRRFLYDVGDAGGCPQAGTTATARGCNGGFDQQDVWYISWGAPPSEPLPEIYTTSGSMAAQWQQLSLYSYLAHGGSMIIAGALTESGACQQVTCPASLQNSASGGWQQLYNSLNGDTRTKQTLSWSTDIKWLN